MMKTAFGMAVLAALVLSAGAVSACPFGKTAQTQQQTASSSDTTVLPVDGSKTETKTGG